MVNVTASYLFQGMHSLTENLIKSLTFVRLLSPELYFVKCLINVLNSFPSENVHLGVVEKTACCTCASMLFCMFTSGGKAVISVLYLQIANSSKQLKQFKTVVKRIK